MLSPCGAVGVKVRKNGWASFASARLMKSTAFVGQHVGEVIFLVGAVLDHRAVLVQAVVEVSRGPAVGAVPLVPPRRDVGGVDRVSDQVLADPGGVVPRVVEPGGQGGLVALRGRVAIGAHVHELLEPAGRVGCC